MFVILYSHFDKYRLTIKIKSFHETLDEAKEKLTDYEQKLTECIKGDWHFEKYRIMTSKESDKFQYGEYFSKDAVFYIDDDLEVNNRWTKNYYK